MSEVSGNNPENKKKILMVSPEEFAESVLDEKWDDSGKNAADVVNSRFNFLSNALKSAGVQVEIVDGKKDTGSKKELWTRDSYFAFNGKVYLPADSQNLKIKPPFLHEHGRHNDANEDNTQIGDYFAKKNIPVESLDFNFQGGNVLTDEKNNTIFLAGERNYPKYAKITNEQHDAYTKSITENMASHTGANVVYLDLNSKDKYKLQNYNDENKRFYHSETTRFYHLDTCMCLLPDGTAIVYPGAFEESSYKKIQDMIGKDKIIELTRDEAERYPTNNLVANRIIIAPSMPERVEKILNEKGYSVITDDKMGMPDGFLVRDSSVHCLTNDIPEIKSR